MEKKLRLELEFLEYNAHIHAFRTDELGKYYWDKFLIKEHEYNSKYSDKYGVYKRRW